jgi:hypothetical protein
MSPEVAAAGPLVAILVLSLGPLAALLAVVALQNRRDRRAAWLLGIAMSQFSAEALRSDVVVRVRAGLLARRADVIVDMRPCGRDEVWAAISRLRQALPSWVRVRVDGELVPRVGARFTVEAAGEAGGLAASRVGGPAAC